MVNGIGILGKHDLWHPQELWTGECRLQLVFCCSVKHENEVFSLGQEREKREDLPGFLKSVACLLAIYRHKDSIMKLYLITFILIISQ